MQDSDPIKKFLHTKKTADRFSIPKLTAVPQFFPDGKSSGFYIKLPMIFLIAHMIQQHREYQESS